MSTELLMEKRTFFAKDLAAILLKNQVISESLASGLSQAFKESSQESFDDFLLEEHIVPRGALLSALSSYYKVPSVDVVGYFFQSFLLHKFPKDILHRYVFIPMDVDDEILTVVASEPDNPRLLPIIGEYVSYDIVLRVGIRIDITDAITEYYDESITQVPDDVDIRFERSMGREFRQESLLKEEESEVISHEDIID